MDGLKWKYGIVERILKQSWSLEVLGEALYMAMQEYLGQGVVFKSAETRVALS